MIQRLQVLLPQEDYERLLKPLLLPLAIVVLGLLVHASRAPERFLPGRLDFIGNSRNVRNLCLIAVALIRVSNVLGWEEWRKDYGAPPALSLSAVGVQVDTPTQIVRF